MRSRLTAVLANPKVEDAVLEKHLEILKTTIAEGRKRWLVFEETHDVQDLGNKQLYTRDSFYPKEVFNLIEYLVSEKYGRRHPGQIIANRARIDLPYSARALSKEMLQDQKNDFLEAMQRKTWKSADGITHRVPHHTFIEKYIRSLPHIKYKSYFGTYFSCRICLEKVLCFIALVSVLINKHKAWSHNCFNAKCARGALQNYKNARILRSTKMSHMSACNGRCISKRCTQLFKRFSSLRRFVYSVIEKADCKLIDRVLK